MYELYRKQWVHLLDGSTVEREDYEGSEVLIEITKIEDKDRHFLEVLRDGVGRGD